LIALRFLALRSYPASMPDISLDKACFAILAKLRLLPAALQEAPGSNGHIIP
jgi:hypothetical protein